MINESNEIPMDTPYANGFVYNPNKKGLRKVLGNLEADIMEILWDWGRGTVREVHGRLNEDRPLAYTTIMTVMSRLADKGLLRREKAGIAYIYHPTSTREMFTQYTVGRIITDLLDDFSKTAISQFIETIEKTHPDKMDELARLIGERQG